VFAARIAPTKNLLFVLEVLSRCTGSIHLDIVGPLEVPDYWAQCRALMQQLPPTVTAEYVGEAAHHDLQRRLSGYDVMLLPTLGENFGHVIVEAWAAGCPVIVSDRTPWRDLRSRDLGWDLPLNHAAWASAIDECLEMSAEAHLALRRRMREHARRVWREGIEGQAALRRLIAEAVAPTGVTDLVTRPDGAGDPCA
jgi:glycosyltransferase involved in cell wall biosynthesis